MENFRNNFVKRMVQIFSLVIQTYSSLTPGQLEKVGWIWPFGEHDHIVRGTEYIKWGKIQEFFLQKEWYQFCFQNRTHKKRFWDIAVFCSLFGRKMDKIGDYDHIWKSLGIILQKEWYRFFKNHKHKFSFST